MKICFVDAVTTRPYDAESLSKADNGIGGAEASLIRVAQSLARRGNEVRVVQPQQTATYVSGSVAWSPREDLAAAARDADSIVMMRRIGDAPKIRAYNRRAKLVVWYHDWYLFTDADGGGLRPTARAAMHEALDVHLVAVSPALERNMYDYFATGTPSALSARLARRTNSHVIPNPVEVHEPQGGSRAYDRDKLIFFGSAWKGLDQVLDTFAAARTVIPSLRLHLATPGYGDRSDASVPDGVTILGVLGREELSRHVAESLCVFYPANAVPETFGLVFPESHALGTPVMAHDFGAASQFLCAEELVDAANVSDVVAKLARWHAGARPMVSAHVDLTVERVTDRWEALLSSR